MNVFKDLKEDMNKSFNEVCESTQWNEIQDLDVEIRSLLKTQTEVKLEMTILRQEKPQKKALPTQEI